jgi:outer membrane protein TolC
MRYPGAGRRGCPAPNTAVANIPAVVATGTVGASLMQVVFDGGKIEGQIAEAKAREEELLAAYRAGMIASFSDVENALGDLSHLTAQEEAPKNQLDQSEKVLASDGRKYAAGMPIFSP